MQIELRFPQIASMVLMTILLFLIFLGGFYLWNNSKGYDVNCKHCSWTEFQDGSCKYSEQELKEQEDGKGDIRCMDMGSYEMSWKFGMMMMWMSGAMILFGWIMFLLEFNKGEAQ